MKLAPYLEYKDSGVPWLEKIPAHWELHRGKWLFRKMERPVCSHDQVVTCFRDGTVTLRKNRRTRGFTESLKEIGYQGIRKGDLVIHQMDAFAGAVGVSDSSGKGTPVYSVCLPKKDLDMHYYAQLIREMSRSEYITSLAKGIRERSTGFSFDTFASITFPVPSLDEQKKISRFLRNESAQINKFTRNKRQLIELLKEQKQNVINQTVTRGLDPNVKLKPSGVEWIGDIPEHWDVRKLKFASKMIVGGATPASGQSELWDGDIVWVTPQDVSKNERLSSSARNLTSAGVASCSSVLVPPGSVVVTSRAPVGNVSFAEVELCTNQGCKAVVPDDRRLLNEYSLIILKAMKPVFQRAANGTTFFEISTWDFENIKVPLPPISEQEALLAQIRETTLKIDQAITRAQREIELIQEYRTRLISDVVTGQVDVRGIEAPELAGEALLPLNEGAGKSDYDNSGREPILGEEGIKQSRRRFNATENEPKSTLGV